MATQRAYRLVRFPPPVMVGLIDEYSSVLHARFPDLEGDILTPPNAAFTDPEGAWVASHYLYYAIVTCFSGLWSAAGVEYTPSRILLCEYDDGDVVETKDMGVQEGHAR